MATEKIESMSRTSSENLLEIEDLSTKFFIEEGTVSAVDNVSFSVSPGEVFGIVGESGSGKSVTALSIMDLIKSPGRVTGGAIRFKNEELATKIEQHHPDAVEGDVIDLRKLPPNARDVIRGREISMVFQDPERSFNKSLTVGEQIAEAVEVNRRTDLHRHLGNNNYGLGDYAMDLVLPSRKYVSDESFDRAIELLEMVGIPDPELRATEYPNQFSGGMLQRAMIAQALAGDPSLLIADEPTSALDVTIQSQILELIDEMRQEVNLGVILISHNFGVIARISDQIGVMYAGQMVERGTITDIFERSVHPYTEGLIGAVPDVDHASERLKQIEGHVPNLIDMPNECHFVDRCPKAMDKCYDEPPEFEANGSHRVKCYLAEMEYDPDRAVEQKPGAESATERKPQPNNDD